MTTKTTIDNDLHTELAAVAASRGCNLLAAEIKGGTLRLVLDRLQGGVTIDDCADVSRQVSALLDVLEFDPGRYTLEVSSPGLDRPLYRPSDYERFQGRLARVTFVDPDSEARRSTTGRLEGFDRTGDGTLTIVDEQTSEPVMIPFERITSARLEIEL